MSRETKSEDEGLAALRRAWAAAPEARPLGSEDGLPPAALEACDAATRDAVALLQRAWRAQEVEAPPLPLQLARRRQRVRPTRWALRLAALAAAACALLLARLELARPAQPAERGAQREVADASPRSVPTTPIPATPTWASYLDIPRENVHLRADGVEFESAGIRFVLIDTRGIDTDSTEDHDGATPSTASPSRAEEPRNRK